MNLEMKKISNERCNEITEIINSGNLTKIKAYWHINEKDIDFNLQSHKLTDELLDERFTIIKSVDIKLIIASLEEGYHDFFYTKPLIIDSKCCRIIDYWLKKESLIPPFLIWNEQNKLNCILDGKHRLLLAYRIGVKQIPIIISKKYFDNAYSLIFIQ